MIRALLLASATVIASGALAFLLQPAEAGSCTVITAEGRGAKEAKASARAEKHLVFKINRWASRNGYSSVRSAKSSTVCAPKAVVVSCIATRKVCG
jgi:hypothetical protein